MTFTCPRCGAVSHHPMDEDYGYCGKCHDFTGPSLRQKQAAAWFELRQAVDQMAAARWCEEHPDSPLEIPEHGDLVCWLLDQLATCQRLDRVDVALARQLGQSIEHNSRLKTALLALYQWYDRDGSVGGASEIFEAHRSALNDTRPERP